MNIDPHSSVTAARSFPHSAVFIYDHDLRYTSVGGEKLAYLERARTDDVGRTVHELFDVKEAAIREPAYRRALAGESLVIDTSLNDRVLETYLSPLLDAQGNIVAAMGYTLDVTEIRVEHENTLTSQAFQSAVLAASPDLIHVRDALTSRLLWTSKSITSMLGYTLEDVTRLGSLLNDTLVPQEDRARFDEASAAVCDVIDGDVVQVRHRVLHADGSYRWLSRRLTPFRRDDTGRVTQVLGVSRDVTDTVAVEERLEHAALHDGLTGLPNRRLLHDRLTSALRLGDPTARTAVLFVDLDSFKAVNDTHGHPAGDTVLTEVAVRLTGAVRDGDTVARLGGDEFVLVVRVVESDDPSKAAVEVAGRVREALAPGVWADEKLHVVTASIGIATPAQGSSADDVLREADRAMYRAKAFGKDRYIIG